MSESSIPVDLFNPGQVFACLGIIESAETLLGPTASGFDWTNPGDARFHISVDGVSDPVKHVLGFLAKADASVIVPHGSELSVGTWRLQSEETPLNRPFPQPNPPAPAALPALLSDGSNRIVVDSWGDATKRDNVKFWAGSGGYPGAALIRDCLDLVRDKLEGASSDPFAVAAPQSSSLRFDWRRDYVPMGIGFSLNEHGKASMVPLGYPIVEVLAVLGLAFARPSRVDRKSKLGYRYSVLGEPDLPVGLHRVALGDTSLPFNSRRFRMALDWPGQENQARCITSVIEEPPR